MQTDLPPKDLGSIWRQQPPEEYKVSLKLIRFKAEQLARKTRSKFVANCGIAVALIVFDIWNFVSSPLLLQRIAFALAAAWALYVLIYAWRSIKPETLAEEAGYESCLSYALNELERNLKYSGRSGLTQAGLILFTLGICVAPFVHQLLSNPGQIGKSRPVLTLLLIWIVALIIMETRQRQKLRREISELSGLSRE